MCRRQYFNKMNETPFFLSCISNSVQRVFRLANLIRTLIRNSQSCPGIFHNSSVTLNHILKILTRTKYFQISDTVAQETFSKSIVPFLKPMIFVDTQLFVYDFLVLVRSYSPELQNEVHLAEPLELGLFVTSFPVDTNCLTLGYCR